ncbi:MAG: hypothetical protein JWQ43_1442, partial [Glaciihabitans sp.]|nr:hypothetical protein [Glaciihabitans sp.]
NGSGTKAADGSSVINWTGSFSVVFYGGLTYWTVTDPTLTIDANGDGQLTGTASGYGTSMEDMTQWVKIAPQEIVLADIDGATVTDTGFTATPDYLSVSVTTSSTAQSTTGTSWGSFPQSFVDFQQLTGQSSYWYSSGGSRDAAKPTSPLTVSYVTTAAEVEEPTTPPADDEQTIEVTVPTKDTTPTTPSGSFGWSFEDAAAVSLGTATQTGSSFTAAGTLNTIEVTDNRAGGTAPYSWSISGQVGDFSSAANSFGAEYLGWTPTVSNAGTGVSAGAAVTSLVSGGAGLAESASLAKSTTAANATINTELSLVIPNSTTAGDYTATLTVTALS